MEERIRFIGEYLSGEYTISDLCRCYGISRKTGYKGIHRFEEEDVDGLTEGKESNAVWCMDFKGSFRTGDQRSCSPSTISDYHTRFFLGCQGMERTDGECVQAILERIFRELGLPEVIRTDNGPPFASVGLGGLTRVSVWWIQLGIVPKRIEPGQPQQNGRHERLHRTLKEATLHPPAGTLRKQQERFDRFLEEYNWERPHEALGQIPPGELYEPSARPYPGKVPEMEYSEDRQVRCVKGSGEISWRNRHWYLSEALAGEPDRSGGDRGTVLANQFWGVDPGEAGSGQEGRDPGALFAAKRRGRSASRDRRGRDGHGCVKGL
ncbi:MAG TPA: integrase core domain-containing protein [bacterium]|nr:integrase core domain-containing protein [bacterium]HQL60818.1 integrase core domain-containing protein [bacterium]